MRVFFLCVCVCVTCRVALKEGRLRVMSSGNDLPVIDLRNVDVKLCDMAAQKCDLVILEGMGRAMETNLNARFT